MAMINPTSMGRTLARKVYSKLCTKKKIEVRKKDDDPELVTEFCLSFELIFDSPVRWEGPPSSLSPLKRHESSLADLAIPNKQPCGSPVCDQPACLAKNPEQTTPWMQE